MGIPSGDHGLPWLQPEALGTQQGVEVWAAGEEPRSCPQSPGGSTCPQGTAAQVCDSADCCPVRPRETPTSLDFSTFSLNFSEGVLWARGNQLLELSWLSPRIDLEVRPPGRCRNRPRGEAPWASRRTPILLYSRTCGKTLKVLLRGSLERGFRPPGTHRPLQCLRLHGSPRTKLRQETHLDRVKRVSHQHACHTWRKEGGLVTQCLRNLLCLAPPMGPSTLMAGGGGQGLGSR